MGVVTDRFATTNGTNPRCVASERVFCGGSWLGLVRQLDYIQEMGFDAVWISPIQESIDNMDVGAGQAYHRYWPTNHFALQDTAANLLTLSDALHARGMALMVDMVENHVAWKVPDNRAAFNPANGQYGALNRSEDYHPPCVINYSSVQNRDVCWIYTTNTPKSVVLPDINTTSARVRTLLYNRVSELVKTYRIDGLRCDAAWLIEIDFWKGYTEAAGVFTMGEVLNGGESLDVVYYPLSRAFTSTSGSMKDLSNMIGTLAFSYDTTVLGGFVSNHDIPRPRSITKDSSLLANLFSFSFISDGIPVFYCGDETDNAVGAGDPLNREALWTLSSTPYDTSLTTYKAVTLLNAVRKAAGLFSLNFWDLKMTVVQYTSNDIVLSKYPLMSVLTNRGSKQSGSSVITFPTSYPAGTVVVNTLLCTKSTVNAAGQLSALIAGGLPQIFLPLSAITSDSGFCPSIVTAQPCASKTALRTAASSPTASISSS
ncbi:glycoside hydrolase superfamily [Mrakia frigida]|uniref:glycoside hydrolase superfamily n=1 Tax=Mrakia frigida TaxID=29902 RepID=UPI003FCBF38A